jgi:ankyrin repeat protein
MYTALRSDASMARLLLDHGADVTVPNDDGKTPLQISMEQDPDDHFGVAALLKAASKKPSQAHAPEGKP